MGLPNFDPNQLLLSLFVSSIGYVLFRYGRKQERVPQIVVGLAMMVFPYFVTSILWMTTVAVLLVGLFVMSIKLGF